MQDLQSLEEIFEMEPGSLTKETVLADLDEWDSLSKLSLSIAFWDNYSIKLTAEMMDEFKTVADILAKMHR